VASAAPASQAPATAKAIVQPSAQTASGTVVETMDASNYTYVRVKTSVGEFWAASARFEVAVGDRVVVPLELPMQNFHSASLNRDFPVIYFVSRITREGKAAPASVSGAASEAGSATAKADASAVTEVIAPAPGGMTISEIWARRATLAGKAVTVRGKVVKFNGGILGRNWMHIQDGTGTAKDGSNDLTITTDAIARVGDVVTATGKIALDKDFGAGYIYATILEGAAGAVK
jgi:hypothetical protein